jgi:type IV pilus assembly protein PilN
MIQINLLPVREERRKANLRQLAMLMGVTVVGSAVLAAGFHIKMKGDISGARTRLAQTQQEIDRLKPQVDQVEHYRETKVQIEQKLDVIKRLDRSRSGPVHVLDELASHTPERMWLTKLRAEAGKITIEGMSLDNELVALFLTSLTDSPYFGEVELEETKAAQLDGLKLNQFRLEAALTEEGSGADDKATSPAAGAPAGPAR